MNTAFRTYQVFRSLAEQGDARGQNGLGNMYVTGQGVAKDDVEAVRWYRMAAKQGHAQAQHNLGVMYERHSVKRSRVELRGGYWAKRKIYGKHRRVGAAKCRKCDGVYRLYLSAQRKSGLDGSMGRIDCRGRTKCGYSEHIPGCCPGYASAFWGALLLAFEAISLSSLCCRKYGTVFFTR